MVNFTTTTEDTHQHIQWVRGSRHLCSSMHVCMYLCKVVVGKRCACKCIPLCASHDNVMRACTNAILSGTVHCMVDGWMDDCDEWQW